MLSMRERRRFIRHPICYPLEFEYLHKKISRKSHTVNVSEGGLMFLSKRRARCGEKVILKLPVQNKLFKVRATIMHVHADPENPKLYNIGVSFFQYSDAFKVKLIEQVYLIDEYRSLCSIQRGRDISFKEASLEWIKLYSKRFDKLFWGSEKKKKEIEVIAKRKKKRRKKKTK